MICVCVSASPGDDIMDTVCECRELSEKIDAPVKLTFNGVVLRISKTDWISDIIDEYEERAKSSPNRMEED